jgi:hypothetical protein
MTFFHCKENTRFLAAKKTWHSSLQERKHSIPPCKENDNIPHCKENLTTSHCKENTK